MLWGVDGIVWVCVLLRWKLVHLTVNLTNFGIF
jgi:hypothetical protein